MTKDREVSRVEIRDWGGLVTHADRQDIAPGAGRLQVNMQSDRPGALRVRRGLSLVQFDARGLVEVSDILSVQETVNAAITFNGIASETVTLAETLATLFVHVSAAISNVVTVSESMQVLLSRFIPVSDAVTVTESVVADYFFSTIDTLWSGSANSKLYLQSGEFSLTIKTSQSVSSVVPGTNVLSGISWDGTNTPWAAGGYAKLYLQSGKFASTVKTSQSVSVGASGVTGISWDGTNTPWVNTSAAKLVLQSGQFSSTIKTSRGSLSSNPSHVSWDGTNTPFSATSVVKLFLQSGQFASTLKTSQSGFSDNQTGGISWDNTNTLWMSKGSVAKMHIVSGQFSSTIKTSRSVAGVDSNPKGIETNNVSGRIS